MTGAEQDPRRQIRRLNLAGFAAIVLLGGGAGAWAVTSQLQGAVIAPGTLVVESNVKKVQHPTGGVVGELRVRDGSHVTAGEIVVRLDDTTTRANLAIVVKSLDELAARQARLEAERDDDEKIDFPAELLARKSDRNLARILGSEQILFELRQKARAGQKSQLRERIAQLQDEIIGLTEQADAKKNEMDLIHEELKGVRELWENRLVSIQRWMALRREAARLTGERGQLISRIAQAKGKITEIKLQVLQIDQDLRSEVAKELREIQGKSAELVERRVAAEDQLKRIDIRAPQNGIVNQLSVHTVGGVIANGETIMQIVPVTDELLVEAKVSPQDIDQVVPKARTIVRIMSGNQRTLTDIVGEVAYIGPDLTREKEQPNLAYYLVRASIAQDQLRRLEGLKLVPGMPAEIFIQTEERTPLQYLMKPLREQISRTFRER